VSTAATRSRSTSSTTWASTTCPARRSGCRWHASRRVARPWRGGLATPADGRAGRPPRKRPTREPAERARRRAPARPGRGGDCSAQRDEPVALDPPGGESGPAPARDLEAAGDGGDDQPVVGELGDELGRQDRGLGRDEDAVERG